MKLSKLQIISISALLLSLLAVSLLYSHIIATTDENKYDYCVEWSGSIKRSNLIYNCYELATGEFNCDYKIMEDGRLRVKPIENATRGPDGHFERIKYGNATFHNCSRWVKTKHVEENEKDITLKKTIK